MDEAVFDFMADHRRPGLTRFLRFLVRLDGNLWFLLAVALVFVGVLVARRAWRPLLGAVIAFAVADLASAVMKALIDRPRPAGRPGAMYRSLEGSAMPSSHAMTGAAVAVAVLTLVDWRHRWTRRTAIALVVAAVVLVGAAMAYVSAHWASDMVIGWGLGAVIGSVAAPAADLLVGRWERLADSAVLPEPALQGPGSVERDRVEAGHVVGGK